MIPTIAFVGAGPTTIYTLHALLRAAKDPFRLVIFEEQEVAGRGTPYRPGWNDPAMLSNIASIEIPPLERSLVDWLRDQPATRLEALGIDDDEIDERAFYPRLALGAYLSDQFEALVAHARARGIDIALRTRSRVIDILPADDGFTLKVKRGVGEPTEARCDRLVLATGHKWPDEPEVRPGYFLSPWPASALHRVRPCAVGIRGTSLTAIDAAVVLALRFGDFVAAGEVLRYVPAEGSDDFQLTMMSRKGLLPEADFFHPIPYEPLSLCTPEAMAALVEAGTDGLLERAFALFKLELAAADPAYAAHVGLDGLDLEGFREGYFADRAAADPFAWAQANLAEAQRNEASETTVPWRYAILRMHEVIAPIVPQLDDADFDRFNRLLKPVFVDDYATVPHESIRRMLALHTAGKLELIALGERARVDAKDGERGASVRFGGARRDFATFIEATGQHPLGVEDFPFAGLREAGIVQDSIGDDGGKAGRGVAVDEDFHPIGEDGSCDPRLFCVSLPFILGRHPFVQGITSSFELGEIVGQALATALAGERDAKGKAA
jgi:uncharacterized NAD(P)/FAD-binding protein YdhS